MSLIRPFAALRPTPERTADVAAPPYDVLSRAEAREQAEHTPWSFLHISRPEIDLSPSIDAYAPEVYNKGKENFERMLREGILQQDQAAYYYLYRLCMGEHRQTGLVAVASVADYDSNRIRKHEHTRPDKESDRVHQIDTLNAQTGPVLLAYRHHPVIDTLVKQVTELPPEIDIHAGHGVQHSLWLVRDAKQMATISTTFNAMDCLYIADGHHRSAAASRVATQRRRENPAPTGEENYNYFLTVIFPDNQLQILDYNRVVRDLNGLTVDAFVQSLHQAFTVESTRHPVKPAVAGEFGMYLAGRWHRLKIKPDRIPRHDPVGHLDVSLLTDNLIAPLLGISDPRRDQRIDFVGGIRGLDELERRVDSGTMAVAFALFPTTLTDLMAVADAGKVMPPKSTWFEPKLADGLVSHLL